MKDTMDLSIIIPAYREGPDFKAKLEKLADWLKHHDYGHVEVVVMMQSDDKTGDVAAAELEEHAHRFENLRIVNLGRRAGKGGAVRAGMFEATGRYRLFMDADLATPLVHLDDVKRLMERGDKVGIAVRNLMTIHKNLTRALISKLSNIIVQVVVLPGIKDTQCGFKVFEAQAAEEIFSRQTLTSWSFDVEVLAIARHLGYRIMTFEAPDWKDPKGETQGLAGDSPIKVAMAEARDPLMVRWNLWTGRYNRKSFKYEPKQAK